MIVGITGSRGFVGSWVTEAFEEVGDTVIGLSNLSHPSKNSEGREYVYGDVRYEYDVDNFVKNVDCVVHLAARINVDRSRESARPFVDTNIIGTFNILEACRKYGKKLIHASTSEALGNMQENHNLGLGMNEYHPYAPDNPYGATKAAADMLVLGWIKSYDLQAIILRSFNITGAGQAYDKEGAFIPKVINRIINNQNPVIFGAGDQTRDYVWVGDVAAAYVTLAHCEREGVKKWGEIFHTGTGKEVSITYVAKKLIEISKKNLTIDYVEARPKEVKRLKADWSKIARLGWKPTRDIDSILEEMYVDTLCGERV